MLTTEEKARELANGLGITLWIITKDGRDRIVQRKPARGGTEIRPAREAKPTPHGAPQDTGKISDGG
jgi:hypothetical protein